VLQSTSIFLWYNYCLWYLRETFFLRYWGFELRDYIPWATSPALFCARSFRERVSQTICLGWLRWRPALFFFFAPPGSKPRSIALANRAFYQWATRSPKRFYLISWIKHYWLSILFEKLPWVLEVLICKMFNCQNENFGFPGRRSGSSSKNAYSRFKPQCRPKKTKRQFLFLQTPNSTNSQLQYPVIGILTSSSEGQGRLEKTSREAHTNQFSRDFDV
jgi:hypothetical protein